MKIPELKKYKKLVLNDFSLHARTDENLKDKFLTDISYNFAMSNKILKTGVGASKALLPLKNSFNSEFTNLNTESLGLTHINNILYFKQYFPSSDTTQHRILLHGSDNKLYVHQMFSENGTFVWLYSLEFPTPPVCLTYKLEGKDTIILSTPEKMMVWTTDLLPYEITDIPSITSMCVHEKVLFCTISGEANKIWCCLSNNPEMISNNSDYARCFSLDDDLGYSRKILTFKENLYAFRDYGITRIQYYAESDCSFKTCYISDSQIIPETITICGDDIMFLTRDGLYRFDGVNVNKIMLGIEKYLSNDNSNSVGCCLQDKFYLALKLNFNDDKKFLCENEAFINNAILVMDLNDYSFELVRGIDIKSMLVIKTEVVEKVLVTFNTGELTTIAELDSRGKLFDETLPKFYSTNYIFDDDLNKFIIRKLSLIASKDVTINIVTPNNSYSFTTKTEGLNEFNTLIECNNFKIEVNSSQNCEVKHLEIDYYKA